MPTQPVNGLLFFGFSALPTPVTIIMGVDFEPAPVIMGVDFEPAPVLERLRVLILR